MSSNVFDSWKINWVKVVAITTVAAVVVTVIGYIILGASEGNGMVILGLISLVIGLAMAFESDWDKKTGRLQLYVCVASLLLLFLASPFLHLADRGKVWIIDDKTTLGNSFLFRLPFVSPAATSVHKNQNASLSFTASTKEGATFAGTVYGAFRLTDDDQELILRIGAMEDPDKAISVALEKVMGRAFGDAIARRSVADISALSNNFALDVDVGTATAVKQLGLRRNGTITVYGLRPYFFDR